jgi:SUMO ligase MMS21 Smc5/6 complex component
MSELVFKSYSRKEDVSKVINPNMKAFSAGPLITWSEDSVRDEIKNGWDFYAVSFNKDIVAGLFVKNEDGKLLTKNTPLNIQYQGNAFSHRIKEFYETLAVDSNCFEVINLCGSDNFRTIALNESHGYILQGKEEEQGYEIQTWCKKIV